MGFLRLNMLAGWVSDAMNTLFAGIEAYINVYLKLWSNLWYVLFLGLAKIMDLLQILFRLMAGLGEYRMAGETSNTTGDIVVGLITSSDVMNMFYTILILSLVILFITTFVAVLKSQYEPLDSKGKTSTGKILGKSMRAVLQFITVPVVVIFYTISLRIF